jgi:hypothetical protein
MHTPFRRTAFLLFLFLTLSGFAAAAVYNWPVEKIRLTATFGETRGDHFHSGIDLGGDGQRVSPIARGDVVYYFDEGEHPLYRTFGNGNMMILEHAHPDEAAKGKTAAQAVRSHYYHLQKNSVAHAITLPASAKTAFDTNEVLGYSGNSGRSFGAHLHLGLSDSKGYINPLSELPPYPDRVAPEVASIMFGLYDMERVITIQKKYTATGIDDFVFLARVWDSQEDIRNVNILGPYRVVFALDGKIVKTIIFDRLNEKDGRLTLSDGTAFSETWSEDGYISGGSLRGLVGQHELSVLAEDFAGNQTTYSAEVQFR